MKLMITLAFSAYNPNNQYIEGTYSNPNFDVCLDQLSFLVNCNWQLIRVKCRYQTGAYFPLPTEAFDGCPFGPTIEHLQREWEGLLTRI
jgi:hypothetical protein